MVRFPLLKGYDTVPQPVTACIPGSWILVSPRAAPMLLLCNTVPSHFSICTRALILSFRTQKMRMAKTSVSSLRMRMTFFPSRTAWIMKLTSQHVCLFMVEQTFICTDHQHIGGQSTCANEAREKSFVRLALRYDFSVGKR